MSEETVTLPPALKWAGGKRWLVPILFPLWRSQPKKRLVEPFAGGLAATLGLRPERALLNDVNPHLINFWKHLQEGLFINLDMRNDSALYYTYREKFNELIQHGEINTQEAAELFYYLNRTGFNGLCRFNSKGFFNVPFGRYNKITYTRDFRGYIEIFQNWNFSCSDFEQLKVASDDLIYADPPYDTPFTTYSAGGFDWQDQMRLAKWLADHRGPVVTSNQATERILDLYRNLGFSIQILNAPRMISCTGDRTKAQEMFATKGLQWHQEILQQAAS